MIKFVVDYKKLNFNHNLIYLLSEMSFYVNYSNKDVYSLMLGSGYVGLDIDVESSKALGITGYSCKTYWKKHKLKVPQYRTGELKIVSKEKLLSGTGSYYAKDWETFYDPASGWICIGSKDDSTKNDCVEFFKNIIAVVNNEKLVAIWIKLIIK